MQSRSSGFIGQWLLIGGAFWQKRYEKHLVKPGKLPVPEIGQSQSHRFLLFDRQACCCPEYIIEQGQNRGVIAVGVLTFGAVMHPMKVRRNDEEP